MSTSTRSEKPDTQTVMYTEVPILGNEYKKGDWEKIAIHDDQNVKGFFGPYNWLSNFYNSPVWYEGIYYRSSENAYQAAKLLPHYREALKEVTASASKKLWRTFGEDSLYDNNPEEWDYRKYDVMSSVVFDKFYRNTLLREKLLETKDKHLEELNWWRDTFWGVDIKLGGQNNLGKILMKARNYWG